METLDFNDSDVEEELESVSAGFKFVRWATFLVAGVLWMVAGNGQKKDDNCGKYSHLKICDNVDKHGRQTLDGKNYAGKIFRRIIHNSCGRPSCPECYISWAS